MNIELLSIYLFLFFALSCSAMIVWVRSIFSTILFLNLFSAICTILYFFLNAPDVAMTEAGVGVFLTTAFALMTARIVKTETCKKQSLHKLVLSIFASAFLSYIIFKSIALLGSFGSVEVPMNGSGGMYLMASYNEFKIPNVVTIILGSFRSFDTLGETMIIFTTAISIFAILKLTKNAKFYSL